MRKAWPYITTFLAGVIAGIITMYKLMGEQIEVNVRRIKNKRTSGKTTTSIPLNIESAKKRVKTPSERKKARIARRLKRKL